MDTKEIFSKRLLELREEKGISRQIAADSLQISRASLEYYEKGLRLPDVCVLAKIADYYCVSADYLLGRSEVKSIDPDKQLNIACEYTGLSEDSVEILNQTSVSSDYQIINMLISSFINNLINQKGITKEYVNSLLDILCISSKKGASVDLGELHNKAADAGYCLFEFSEVLEYWKSKLHELIYSASKEACDETIVRFLRIVNKQAQEK